MADGTSYDSLGATILDALGATPSMLTLAGVVFFCTALIYGDHHSARLLSLS